ncbi:AMP-dependent synthetase/ligase [Sedimenticola thiotaurini]|uniref:AMP-dependent synthetase n=1 Tax=Sedimenticola thiotaurini TaxID=1543721 RepID=A0A0F7JWK4_9GAMM|nr:AMP-dependent synthetase/ligase [Sedimenticola thiotaurini]AKH20891.1 AMP-dependent synthetase [Sedimenticola thiotaurini]
MNQWSEDLISVEQARTLDGLFQQRVKRSPDRLAYRHYDRHTKAWQDLSWQEMGRRVARWQAVLKQQGLHPGDRVALSLRNSPDWVAFDQASLGLGLVVVPLYTDDRPDNVAYILQDAAVKLLLVQDSARWKRLARAIPADSPLQRVLIQDSSDGNGGLAASDARVRRVADLMPAQDLTMLPRHGDPHSLASIVYTSGTTGRPKGVMLSHHNMLSIAHASITVIDCFQEDQFLSFLPLSHTLERTAGYYLPIMTGSSVAYSRSIGQLAEDLTLLRPTVLIAVPRIFERVYGRITSQMQKRTLLPRLLFRAAVRVGWLRFERSQGRVGLRPSLLLWPLLDRLVASKVTARLGGRLRIAVSGGAPLSAEIARLFIGLGIPILQGYGLTESSPVVSVNPLEDNDPSSVGVPLRGVEVRTGEDDELLVRGPGVMLGYWNNHSATAKMIDQEGWLHTGDQARIENNHIYITGRIKDILVLSNGEKVPPGDMELAIALDPLVSQVMVLGEGRPYLSALVVVDADHWPALAQDCGLDPMARESLEHHRVTGAVLHRIKEMLKQFPGYAKVRRVTLLLEPWTVENGMLTPTLKIKRAQVLKHHQAAVDAMYQ